MPINIAALMVFASGRTPRAEGRYFCWLWGRREGPSECRQSTDLIFVTSNTVATLTSESVHPANHNKSMPELRRVLAETTGISTGSWTAWGAQGARGSPSRHAPECGGPACIPRRNRSIHIDVCHSGESQMCKRRRLARELEHNFPEAEENGLDRDREWPEDGPTGEWRTHCQVESGKYNIWSWRVTPDPLQLVVYS